MALKLNCWEAKGCGREPGGVNSHTMGICAAVTEMHANGINGGTNGGRVCWAVAGTFCGGEVQGTFADKRLTCMSCEFYKQVREEENHTFRLTIPGQEVTPLCDGGM